MKRSALASLAALLVALGGCVHVEHETHEARRGPPDHAPAHGYRRHHEVEMRWDRHLGAYVVIGVPDHFFLDGHYFRRSAGRWERCKHWKDAHWQRVDVALVPPGLASHYRGKGPKLGRGQGHAKGHGPAKHADD